MIDHAKRSDTEGKVPEVALAIVLILEAFKRRLSPPPTVETEEGMRILEEKGSLENYLIAYE